MLLKRIEWEEEGKEYFINTEDERKVIEKDTMSDLSFHEKERVIDNAIDSLEDGYNTLELIEGTLYEVYDDPFVRIQRKAYLDDLPEEYVLIIDVDVEELDNAGCNNGNYPDVAITLSDGSVLHGKTCNCGRGCSNTWRIPDVGMKFVNKEGLLDYMES